MAAEYKSEYNFNALRQLLRRINGKALLGKNMELPAKFEVLKSNHTTWEFSRQRNAS
jgi:hypothetical protein